MAKSKPIGVRFDLYKLDMIQKEQNLTSVQQVVNYLMDNYGKGGVSINVKLPKLDKIAAKIGVSKPKASNVTYFHEKPVELTLNRQPDPPIGLKGIDLTIWKSENWK
jgi:hypothetical protein